MQKEYKDQAHMTRNNELDNHPKIKGYDFSNDFDFSEFIESYATTGFQGTELYKAISITRTMRDEGVPIYLSFTGNAISSGLRDIITFLVREKKVHTIITTASGIEEDIIKHLSDFKLGEFEVLGRSLFEHGVGRIGNIFVPNTRYLYLERFIKKILSKAQKENLSSPSQIIKLIGQNLGEDSYLYWAAKNNISVFCPGIIDGAIGDLVYFFKQQNKDFLIDVTQDHVSLISDVLNQEKTGSIILGGGISKHYNLNAQIFREGFDYAVYLTTANEYDGSDSGGNQEEAKTWAKIKLNAPTAKVRSDFSITFPLLVASVFKDLGVSSK